MHVYEMDLLKLMVAYFRVAAMRKETQNVLNANYTLVLYTFVIIVFVLSLGFLNFRINYFCLLFEISSSNGPFWVIFNTLIFKSKQQIFCFPTFSKNDRLACQEKANKNFSL